MTRADWEAATPLCHRRRVVGSKSKNHAVYGTCYSPMHYNAAGNCWVCEACGSITLGREVAGRRWEVAA